MKKITMLLSFVLACVLSCCLFLTKDNAKIEKASARVVENNRAILIVGTGEVEVEPDTVQVNFGIRTRAETLQAGQTKLTESFDAVVAKINEVDPNAEVYVNYSSSYPVAENGLLVYEFDYCMIAKSNLVDKKDSLIESIVSSGATSVYNTSYSLKNKTEAYTKALIKAKENADSKVNALFSSVTLKGLREESCYSCCDNSRYGKIKICAQIKAVYEVSNPNETTNTSIIESSTDNQNQSKENLKNKEQKNTTNTEQTKVENKDTSSKLNNQNLSEISSEVKTESKKDLTKNESVATDNTNQKTQNTFKQDEQKEMVATQNDDTLKTVLNDDNYVVRADNTIVRNDEIMTLEETKEIA